MCETVVLPQLRLFWYPILGKLDYKSLYTANIEAMKIRLLEL